MEKGQKELVSVKDFSKITGIGQGFVRRLAESFSEFPCIFIGRRLLISEKAALEWIFDNKERIRNI